jgi:tetratricopeptide (TPR) repeat protein
MGISNSHFIKTLIKKSLFKLSKYSELISCLENLPIKDFDDLVTLGHSYYRISNYKKSVESFLEAQKIQPDDYQINYILGFQFIINGYSEKALPFLLKALDFADSHTHEFILAKIKVFIGNCLTDGREYDKAKSYFEIVLTKYPFHVDAIEGLIDLYRDNSQNELILPFLEDVISRYPDLYPIYIMLANEYHYYLYDSVKAIEYYEKYITSSKRSNRTDSKYGTYTSVMNYGQEIINYYICLIWAGNKEFALKMINERKVLGKFWNKGDKEALLVYFLKTEDWENGYKFAKDFVEQGKNEGININGLLSIFEMRLGKREDAISRITSLYNKYKPETIACAFFGEILEMNQEYNPACEVYRDLVIRYPSNDNWLEDYASCLYLARQFSDSLKEYEKLSKHDPVNAEPKLAIGLCLFQLGEKSRGLQIIDEAFITGKFHNMDSFIVQQAKDLKNHQSA